MSRRRTVVTALATATALGVPALTGCSPASEVPSDWSRVDFSGGSLAVPPETTPGPEPRAALLSWDLTADGRVVGRVDVFRESPPAADSAPATTEDLACPGTGETDSGELRPGEVSVNVFSSRLTAAGVEVRGDTVVCASFANDVDEQTVQVVVQGPDDVVEESLWRPLLASVRVD